MQCDDECMDVDDEEEDFSSRVAYLQHLPRAEFGAAVIAVFEKDSELGDVRRLIESG